MLCELDLFIPKEHGRNKTTLATGQRHFDSHCASLRTANVACIGKHEMSYDFSLETSMEEKI
jgi:hypothetical protein